jgi:hypothetical protein
LALCVVLGMLSDLILFSISAVNAARSAAIQAASVSPSLAIMAATA